MSWTLAEESDALREAILHAHDQGALLVACTGNLSVTTGLGTVAYPAAWEEVIGVAGVELDEDGKPVGMLDVTDLVGFVPEEEQGR